MGKTFKCKLREDESLAEEVRKYTWLYDREDKGYKQPDRTKNVWQATEIVLGYEEGWLQLKWF